MNNEQAMLLSAVQANYYFGHLRIANEQPLLIETERGFKKIRIWEDEALLKLHLQWRERLVNDRYFIDRMYVTRSGFPSIRIGHYSVTCHDAPREQASLAENEELWAGLITHLVQVSRSEPVDDRHFSSSARVHTVFEQAKNMNLQGLDLWKMIDACFSSACGRAEQADRLRDPYRFQSKTFLLPDGFSPGTCTRLFDTLFFELGQSRPADGCRILARFFLNEALANGEQSVHKLFQLLKSGGSFDQKIADLVLAEWLEPDEWIWLVNAGIQAHEGQNDDMTLKTFKQLWDKKILLIHIFRTIFPQPGETVGGTDFGSNGEQSDQSNTFSL
ncbi:hypothetical protein [Sporolactobacillus laevolacticus]|uniref:Uncharacterized protein n=1 Tax=Sporolactobacillus laevolacticus DSM 442 TaxID=1395513 RepID=V6J1L4_9BACL|nr:hypothetical protein [Sporolactobacillus laevolacticus]EST13685.1 hypothetical protein P343_01385 [Sporolactobacillus laevolacticus DSM 442]